MSADLQQQTQDKKVQQIIVVEGLANVGVLLIKLWVGLVSGSLAILSDALHSLTDVANNIIAFGVVKHSAKPADREHPYGHRKFESIAVLGLALLLVILAIELVLHSFRRESVEIISSQVEIILMALVLVINISLAAWQNRWANKLNSAILKADASHTFTDVLTTLVVIIGWQLSSMGWVWIDQICTLGVALFILYLAFGLFRKVMPVLVDEYAVAPEKVKKEVIAVDGVESVSRVRSRWIGQDATLDLIIKVDAKMTTEDAHEVCDAVEQVITEAFQIKDISVHVEPAQHQG